MEKNNLLLKFQTVRNNYALMQAGALMLAAPDARKRFDEYFSLISDHQEARFGYIKYLFDDDGLLGHSLNEFKKSVLRSCINDTYELLKDYIGNNKDKKCILNNISCYQFLYIFRNAFSHSCKFKFNGYEKNMLPVMWNGLSITIEMDGHDIPMDGYLTRIHILELLDDIAQIVADDVI